MQETIHIRGEGGVVFEMALPLQRDIEQRLAKGYLKRVNADGTLYVEQAATDNGGEADTGSHLTNGVPPRPNANAPKAEWVAYAVHVLGMEPDDVEGLTKQDLIDRARAQG